MGAGRGHAGRGLHKCSLAPCEAAESSCLILSGNRASHTLAQAAGLGGNSMFSPRSHKRLLAEPLPLGPAPGPPPAGAAGLTSAHAPAQTASCSPSVKGVFPVTSLAPSSLGQTASLHRVKGGAGPNSTYKKDHRGSLLCVSLWWAGRGGELGCVCALSQDQSSICRTGPLLGSECRALLARARGSLAELPSVEGRREERHL